MRVVLVHNDKVVFAPYISHTLPLVTVTLLTLRFDNLSMNFCHIIKWL